MSEPGRNRMPDVGLCEHSMGCGKVCVARLFFFYMWLVVMRFCVSNGKLGCFKICFARFYASVL